MRRRPRAKENGCSNREMLKIYTLSNCDTCRAATKWLRSQNLPFEEIAIRETPPSITELRAALAGDETALRTLFNTSGREYRAQNMSEKIATMTVPEALKVLSRNGSLVKRPFLIGQGVALVGFSAERWAAALARS